MPNLFSPLLAKVMSGAAALLLLALGVTYLSHRSEISRLNSTITSLEGERDKLKLDKATLQANVSALDGGLKLCNASVESAKRLADQAAANGAALLAQVKKGNAKLDDRIKDIDAMPAQTCADAEAVLRQGAY